MGTGTYCLTSRAAAKLYLGNIPDADGLWIYCSGVTVASAEVTNDALVLIDKAAVTTAHRAVTTNVATIGTATAHGLIAGDSVVITGMADTAYNGIFTVVSVPDTTHFTFTLTHANETEVADTGGKTAEATVLTFAVSTNLTALAAAIVAVTGWKAGVVYNGSADSTDLVVTGALSCSGSANEITLKIEQNYLIDRLADRATDFIEKYCNRKFLARDYSLERYTPIGMNKFAIENYPLINVKRITEGVLDVLKVKYTSTTVNNAYARVTSTGIVLGADAIEQTEITFAAQTILSAMATTIDAVSGWDASVASPDYNGYPSSLLYVQTKYALNAETYLQIPDEPIDNYEFDVNTGIVYIPGGLGEGFRGLFISYRGGYETIPDSLEMACLELVKLKYEKLKYSDALASENLGDYGYSLRDLKDGLSSDMKETLNYYKRRILL